MIKRIYIWILIIFLGSLVISHAGTLTSYPAVSTLQNADIIPVVVNSSNTNGTINWSNLIILISSQATGVNWQSVKGISMSAINWTGANILAGQNGGINWESLRVSFGNTSTSTNWQAFGV